MCTIEYIWMQSISDPSSWWLFLIISLLGQVSSNGCSFVTGSAPIVVPDLCQQPQLLTLLTLPPWIPPMFGRVVVSWYYQMLGCLTTSWLAFHLFQCHHNYFLTLNYLYWSIWLGSVFLIETWMKHYLLRGNLSYKELVPRRESPIGASHFRKPLRWGN